MSALRHSKRQLLVYPLLICGLILATAPNVLAKLPPAQPGSSTVVINEIRSRGPNGGNDEFIELYNRSTSPVNIGGWIIRSANPIGGIVDKATITAGTVLNPGCYYLLTNSSLGAGPYSGSVPGDQTYSVGFSDVSGIALFDGSTAMDAVGMSESTPFREGRSLTPLTTNANRGYERKPVGTDTNDNSSDFLLIAPSNPQNSSSACGISPTSTPEATQTVTAPTNTPTNTPTDTATPTPTNTPTNTPTDTATPTPTNTPTDTATPTPTNTPANTPTDTATPTQNNTAGKTPTDTAARSE